MELVGPTHGMATRKRAAKEQRNGQGGNRLGRLFDSLERLLARPEMANEATADRPQFKLLKYKSKNDVKVLTGQFEEIERTNPWDQMNPFFKEALVGEASSVAELMT